VRKRRPTFRERRDRLRGEGDFADQGKTKVSSLHVALFPKRGPTAGALDVAFYPSTTLLFSADCVRAERTIMIEERKRGIREKEKENSSKVTRVCVSIQTELIKLFKNYLNERTTERFCDRSRGMLANWRKS